MRNYLRIDTTSHLTKSDGKSVHVKNISKGRQVAFIGDSVTDLATKPFVKTFIGYGGVAHREKIKNEAEYFISTKSLAPVLHLVLTDHELEILRAGKFAQLLNTS